MSNEFTSYCIEIRTCRQSVYLSVAILSERRLLVSSSPQSTPLSNPAKFKETGNNILKLLWIESNISKTSPLIPSVKLWNVSGYCG